MAIRKRGGSWEIDYSDLEGRRVRKLFKRKEDAEAQLAKRVSPVVENRYPEVKDDTVATHDNAPDKKENESMTVRMPVRIMSWLRRRAALETIERNRRVSVNTVIVDILRQEMEADRKNKS